MRTQARVVVIGGGIAGCSTLYHLTEEGWSERDALGARRADLRHHLAFRGARVTNFGTNQTMVGLKSHSIALYKALSEDADDPIGYHYADGGIRLAGDERTMEGYRHFASMARGMGVELEVIDAAECARRHPLLATDGLSGGLWDPLDGDVDPSQLCQALARRARRAGAEVHRNTPVTGLVQHHDHSWTVETPKGDIRAEIVVNAGGYRCNEVGALMGVQHPVASMEHQYLITEAIPAIAEAGLRMPLIRCPISDYYCRQERDGLLIGFYEQGCRTWGLDGIDPGFVNALCPDDLDRVMDVLEGRLRAHARAHRGRHQARRQRPHHLHHRRRAARGPRPGAAQRLLHRGPARGARRGWRPRLAARAADRPRRGVLRHLAHRPRAASGRTPPWS